MFFRDKELENRVRDLEIRLHKAVGHIDDLVVAFVCLDGDIDRLDIQHRLLLADFMLHNCQKAHIIKDQTGKSVVEKLETPPEREMFLISIKHELEEKLKARNNLNSSS